MRLQEITFQTDLVTVMIFLLTIFFDFCILLHMAQSSPRMFPSCVNADTNIGHNGHQIVR